jgi:hypothetical protein
MNQRIEKDTKKGMDMRLKALLREYPRLAALPD